MRSWIWVPPFSLFHVDTKDKLVCMVREGNINFVLQLSVLRVFCLIVVCTSFAEEFLLTRGPVPSREITHITYSRFIHLSIDIRCRYHLKAIKISNVYTFKKNSFAISMSEFIFKSWNIFVSMVMYLYKTVLLVLSDAKWQDFFYFLFLFLIYDRLYVYWIQHTFWKPLKFVTYVGFFYQ